MFVLIIGASASGKSEYGEKTACNLAKGGKKLYLATMEPFGEDALYRIKRHHALRASKGFDTLEKYRDLHTCQIENYDTILLECMSNLVANEMFSQNQADYEQRIIKSVLHLKNSAENLVVITNQVFSDGINYPEETENYIKSLGKINAKLATIADEVTEVVCGIAVKIKEKSNEHYM
ncbi:MAG: bifunctional adenosylcobinamide kinase/adenosylcobinamide-phosphate guanylyltransferase [Clostridia bacterium]